MYTWWETPGLFGELRRMRNEMDRLFQRAGYTAPQAAYPLVNVYDDGEAYNVRAEIPGLDPNTLEVTATGDTVSIKGERPPVKEEGVSYHRRERDYGSFSRSLRMPDRIDPEKVAANYKNGILEVKAARAEETKPRKITVKA
jgi:HSP20 family protein